MEILEKKLAETEYSRNELQLQNAGLKAENDLLKRQLQYFQDLFAKSQKSTASSSSQRNSCPNQTAESPGTCSSQKHNNHQQTVISDDEIYNSQQSLGIKADKLNKSDSSSIYSSNNEVSKADKAEDKMHELVSEITDMEAGGASKKKTNEMDIKKKGKRKRSRDPNSSLDSKSSGEISFVLARKN